MMNKKESESISQRCCELTPLEQEALLHIFKAVLESGRAPTTEALQLTMRKPESDVIGILDRLEERDLLLRRKGTQQIVSIYPLSLAPTRHQVVLEDGKRLFAMCAIDALGIPNMFDKNVKVISECEWCKQEITLEIKDGEVSRRSHPHILIWNLERQQGPSAQTCCPWVNFFCSDEHLRKWEDKNSDLSKKGHSEPLEQAYLGTREHYKVYGERVGVR